MKKLLMTSIGLASVLMSAAAEAGSAAPAETTAAPAAETKPRVERVKKNGQVRPEAGSKTGLIWDLADKLSEEKGRPATREEVWEAYKGEVADAREATTATQYGRWVAFHGIQAAVKNVRKAQRDAADANKNVEKEKKAAEREAAKLKKEEEKAAKKAAREKAKADKEAEAAAKKAAKEAAAAKTEQLAAENAAAANAPVDAGALETATDNADASPSDDYDPDA